MGFYARGHAFVFCSLIWHLGASPSGQVFLHVTLIKDEHVIWSTRSDYGGQGHAEPYLLGKSKSLIKGIELAVLRTLFPALVLVATNQARV